MNEIDNPIYTRLTKKKHSLGCRKYIPNLGTFWLKIEQFWPFEETSIFSNGSHLGYRTVLTDTILKGDHPRIIPQKFGCKWPSGF